MASDPAHGGQRGETCRILGSLLPGSPTVVGMSDNIEPTPSDSETPAEAGPPSSRTLRERFGAMTEGRRSFLTGLAVGAAVLGGAWGVTSALDGDSDHDHHRGGRMDKGGHHRDRGGHGEGG